MPTTPNALRYPASSATPNVAQDLQNLASDADKKVIGVFTNATTRSAAISSPTVGQTTYLTSTGALETWNGSAWRQQSAIRPQWTSRAARTGATDSYSPGAYANLITGTFTAAPAGVYLVIAQMGIQSTAAAAGTARITLGSTVLAETRADVTAATVGVYTFPEQYTHAGGDLVYKLDHNAGGPNSVTVINPSTKMIVWFQGATS